MFHTQASLIENELFAQALSVSSSAGKSELKITICVLVLFGFLSLLPKTVVILDKFEHIGYFVPDVDPLILAILIYECKVLKT